MGEDIILKTEDLAVLNEQFSGLDKKIRDGEYVIEARREGEPKYEETHSTISKYFDETKLFVTIRPSETNTASTIKSMSFEFDHYFWGSAGSWSHSENGSVTDSFRIEAASGKTYVYGPQSRDINDYEDATGLLREVRSLGRQKVQDDANAAMYAAWKNAEDARKDQQQARATGLKNDLKL